MKQFCNWWPHRFATNLQCPRPLYLISHRSSQFSYQWKRKHPKQSRPQRLRHWLHFWSRDLLLVMFFTSLPRRYFELREDPGNEVFGTRGRGNSHRALMRMSRSLWAVLQVTQPFDQSNRRKFKNNSIIFWKLNLALHVNIVSIRLRFGGTCRLHRKLTGQV